MSAVLSNPLHCPSSLSYQDFMDCSKAHWTWLQHIAPHWTVLDGIGKNKKSLQCPPMRSNVLQYGPTRSHQVLMKQWNLVIESLYFYTAFQHTPMRSNMLQPGPTRCWWINKIYSFKAFIFPLPSDAPRCDQMCSNQAKPGVYESMKSSHSKRSFFQCLPANSDVLQCAPIRSNQVYRNQWNLVI